MAGVIQSQTVLPFSHENLAGLMRHPILSHSSLSHFINNWNHGKLLAGMLIPHMFKSSRSKSSLKHLLHNIFHCTSLRSGFVVQGNLRKTILLQFFQIVTPVDFEFGNFILQTVNVQFLPSFILSARVQSFIYGSEKFNFSDINFYFFPLLASTHGSKYNCPMLVEFLVLPCLVKLQFSFVFSFIF